MKRWGSKALCLLTAGLLTVAAMPLSAAAEETEILPPEFQVVYTEKEDGGFEALAESREIFIGETGAVTPVRSLAAPANAGAENGDLYSQLNARQKDVYNVLEAATIDKVLAAESAVVGDRFYHRITAGVNGISGLAVSGTFSGDQFLASAAFKKEEASIYTDLLAAITAVRYDHPEMIWLNYIHYGYEVGQADANATPRIYNVIFDFYLEYGGREQTMYNDMMAAARTLAQQAGAQKDTYSKVKAVYDALAARNTYGNPDDRLAHLASSALLTDDKSEPVCEGYARAFKIVCDLLGIPCVTPSSATHMWNNVKMDDGDWYNVDVTWGDSDAKNISYDYLLVGSQAVIKGKPFYQEPDHVEENPYEPYRQQSGVDLLPVKLGFPAKNKANYVYLGKDYDPLTFPDVKRSSWYYSAVESAAQLGLFTGNEKGLFSPGDNITRAQFALVLSKAMGADVSGYTEKAFSDVPTGKWYSGAVAWAKDQGLMVGDGKTFRPSAYITRQEMCVVLDNVLTEKKTPEGMLFPDDAKIARWARNAVYQCRAQGLIQGDNLGYFNPLDNTQRSAAAVVFTKLAPLIRTEETEETGETGETEETEETETTGEEEQSSETSEETESESGEEENSAS